MLEKEGITSRPTDRSMHEFYNAYTGEKCSYGCFYQRIRTSGYSLEEAVLVKNRIQRRFQEQVGENGRICTTCGQFKTWDDFTKESRFTTGHSSICRRCNRERHAKYRSTPDGKIKTKNNRILRRSNLLYREEEYRKNAEWRARNAEYDRERKKQWYSQNRDEIIKREKEREAERFAPGELISYNGQKCRIIAVKKGQGCLLQIDAVRKLWVAKSKLRVYHPRTFCS